MKNRLFYTTLFLANLPFIAFTGLQLRSTLNLENPIINIIAFVVAFIVTNAIYFIIYKRVTKTLKGHVSQLGSLTKGDNEHMDKVPSNPMFSANTLIQANDKLAQELNDIMHFLDGIIKGELDNNVEFSNDQNPLIGALISLQEKLKKDHLEMQKTKQEEEERNWVSTGLAEFSDLLRQDSENLEKMAYNIVSKLVDYIDCNQGALYVINNDQEEEECYEMLASVAYDRQKISETKIKSGEGLVGRCAYEKASIYMTDIPQNYMNISSGLGTANPTNLLIIPCIIDNNIYAIIELASFHNIEAFQIEFIEKLGEGIASSMANVRNNERTSELLKASQNQADELAAHEEELRQNLEEMEATQEDLKRQMALNTEMQKELKFEKFLFETLLNNIPARINFKDKSRKYIRASKSFLERFGKTSNNEIIGKTDVDFFGAEFAKKTMADELEIMNSKQGRINFIEHEVKSEKEQIWKNVSKIPLLDENGECLGMFASVYDITEFKLAELENIELKEKLATYLDE